MLPPIDSEPNRLLDVGEEVLDVICINRHVIFSITIGPR